MRLSKIVATVGPNSQSPEKLEQLIQAGVNIFRLNCSHGQHDILTQVIQSIHQTREKRNLSIGILADLQGPKIRVGLLADHQPIPLKHGQEIRFSAKAEPGHAQEITTLMTPLVVALNIGQTILLDDGNIAMEVTERLGETEVMCRVTQPGLLKEKKGINVPGLLIDVPALTEKDKADCLFALEQQLDFIALSFVQTHRDLVYLKKFIKTINPHPERVPAIIAKIESPTAILDIDQILEHCDGIMVARGDLGVELRLENVPVAQKQLIQAANFAEKPVITATQMLETMIQNPVPTRAEVSDVANAIFDGSDALMLSGETAVGAYVIETVQTMARIMEESEKALPPWHSPDDRERLMQEPLDRATMQFHEAIAQAATAAAKKSDAKAIIVLSYSGKMANRISKRKPKCPIFALTPSLEVFHKLSMLWGVYPVLMPHTDNTDNAILFVENTMKEKGYLNYYDTVIFCAGQTHLPGLTNVLKIYRIGQERQKVPV